VLLVAAPWLADSRGPGVRLSAVSYLVGSVVCHQHAARSFHVAGAQLPVCARCTGLYLAGAWGLLLGVLLPTLGFRDPAAAAAQQWSWRDVLIVAALPMLATLALEWVGLWAVPNAWRAAGSVPAAWATGAMLAESLSFRVRL
jgi:uncharacterized membrane protein